MRTRLAITLALLLTGSAQAQVDRFELGQRLRQFEFGYSGQPDAAARKRALPGLKSATTAFFTGRTAEAGRALDQARLALSGADAPPAELAWATSLMAVPATRLLDGADAELVVTVRQFYSVPGPVPTGAKVAVTLAGGMTTVMETPVTRLPLDIKLAVGTRQDDLDQALSFQVTLPDRPPIQSPPVTIARVARLKERLAKLDEHLNALPAGPPTVERQTARSLRQLLGDLADRKVHETNYPAARLLRQAEEAVAAASRGAAYFGQRKVGEYWLTLPAPGDDITVRLQAPRQAEAGEPLPLVIALHGAGGSENMFFDGYGNGAVANLARERGWLVVAPRSSGFFQTAPAADLIEAVAKLYPVDRKRVYLVGHSMGAAQAVSAAGATPERFAGVAALAGGGQVRATEAVKGVPFFVGVGTEDFTLGAARALVRDLKKAGVTQVMAKEYADAEHLVVVQLALPEIFEWFEKCKRE